MKNGIPPSRNDGRNGILGKARSLAVSAAAGVTLALSNPGVMAQSVGTDTLMSASVSQSGAAFSYPVKLNGATIPPETTIQILPVSTDKADTITTVNLSDLFSLTATNDADNQKLSEAKIKLISKLITRTAQNFGNGQNVVHLHCSPACAQALQSMNISIEGYSIAWDTALSVGSDNVLTIAPKSLNNISIPAEFINNNPGTALGIAGAAGLSLGGLGLAVGALWGRRRKPVAPAAVAPEDAEEEVSTSGGESPTTESELPEDAKIAEVQEKGVKDAIEKLTGILGVTEDSIGINQNNEGDIVLTVDYKDMKIVVGVTSEGSYYLIKDGAPLIDNETLGNKDEHSPKIDFSVLVEGLIRIIDGRITETSELGLNVENEHAAGPEMMATITSIYQFFREKGKGKGGMMNFSEGEGNIRTSRKMSIPDIGHLEIIVKPDGSISLMINDEVNNYPSFNAEAREKFTEIFTRPERGHVDLGSDTIDV